MNIEISKQVTQQFIQFVLQTLKNFSNGYLADFLLYLKIKRDLFQLNLN